jgi:hypothetical protein
MLHSVALRGDKSWGHCYPGRRVVAPPRRSALGHFVIAPSGREDDRLVSAGTGRTTNPEETGHASGSPPAPKGQNRLAQGRARRRSRGAPPCVNGQLRTSVALKGRDKRVPIAPQTRQAERRNDPNAGITRNVTDSLAFAWPVEARESRPSIHIRFAIIRDHIPISVLSCPFGAINLGGIVTQGGASWLRHDALPWAIL